MADGTGAGLPFQDEPEDDQPAPTLQTVDQDADRGTHAGPSPTYDDQVSGLSFAPEVRMPDAVAATVSAPVSAPVPETVPVAVPETVPETVVEALPELAEPAAAPLTLAPAVSGPVELAEGAAPAESEADPDGSASASHPENWASYRPATEVPEKSAASTVRMPKERVPKMTVPKVTMPKVTVPKVSGPKVEMPKISLPKVHAPQLRRPAAQPEPASARAPHAAPPGDLPGYVEYRPSRWPRFVFAVLFIATAIGAVLSIAAAINDGSNWAIGMAACVTGLSMGFWWGLVAWSPTVVSISDGILAVTEGSNNEAVDLKNPAIEVEIGDNPRSPRWRTVVTRPDGSQLVIRRREVDPVEFTALAEHWREIAARERQFIHDRRNR